MMKALIKKLRAIFFFRDIVPIIVHRPYFKVQTLMGLRT